MRCRNKTILPIARAFWAICLILVMGATPVMAASTTPSPASNSSSLSVKQMVSASTTPASNNSNASSSANSKYGTGLYKIDGKWQYYENGKFKAATGLVQRPDTGNWYYVENGFYTKLTTICKKVQNDGNWYFVYNGAWKQKTGLAKRHDNGKWYYIEDGVYSRRTTITKKIVKDGDNNWYFVRRGGYSKETGLAKRHDNGRWYVINKGKYNKNYTGILPSLSNGKLYYATNGAWNKKYSGFVGYKGNKYYVHKGGVVYNKIFKVNGKYYGAQSDGILGKNGWVKVNNLNYYFQNYVINNACIQAKTVLDKVGHTLKNAYDWSTSLKYVRLGINGNYGTLWCAGYAFTKNQGSCYCVAGTLCIMAKMLGYDAIQVDGFVNKNEVHSWVLINEGGQQYIYDVRCYKKIMNQGTAWHYESNYKVMPMEYKAK